MSETKIPTESWALYELVWITDWYDWELAGIAQKDGKRIFFECIEDDWRERKFAIYDPPAEVWEQIDQRRKDFQQWVGTHWDFDEPCVHGVCNLGTVRPEEERKKFYDKYKDCEIEMCGDWQIAIADSAIEI